MLHLAEDSPVLAAAEVPADGRREVADSPASTTQVLHRYGDRVEIRVAAGGADVRAIPDVSPAVLESLSENERFGIEALQLRASDEFVAAKANRPRQDGAECGYFSTV